MEIEVVRFILAFICGHLLTVSGSLTQLVTHNDLASPSTLGFDGFAVLGILIAQGLNLLGIFHLPMSGLAFGSTILVISVASLLRSLFFSDKMKSIWQSSGVKNIILMGLSFNLLIGAVFSVVQFLFISLNFEFPTGLWFGSFKQYQDTDLIFFSLSFLLVAAWIKKNAKVCEYINLGSHFSLNRGIDTIKFQKRALGISFLITSLVISFYGVFSFLGLVFPHIIRKLPWWKNNIKSELLFGPFFAGFVFVVLDLFCFNFNFYGAEFPVGLISSVIGAVVLIFLIGKSSQYSR